MEVTLHKTGGVDVWLMPLSLIGVIVVIGPVMAFALERMPSVWMHEHTLELTLFISGVSCAILLLAYLAAKKVVDSRHRLLRVEGDRVEVLNRKGSRRLGGAKRDEIDVRIGHFTIDGPSGRHVEPVLALRAPRTDWLTMSVDDPGIRWDGDAEEWDEEADYQVTADRWEQLVEALGLSDQFDRR